MRNGGGRCGWDKMEDLGCGRILGGKQRFSLSRDSRTALSQGLSGSHRQPIRIQDDSLTRIQLSSTSTARRSSVLSITFLIILSASSIEALPVIICDFLRLPSRTPLEPSNRYVILLGLLRIAQNGAGSCAANGNFAVRLFQLSFAHELFRNEIRFEIRDNVTDRVPFEVVGDDRTAHREGH